MTAVSEHPGAAFAAAAEAASEPGAAFAAVEITGTVRSVRTLPDTDGWSIVTLDGDADSQGRHARRVRTAVGTLDEGEEPLRQGCAYRFFGRWVHHDRHGDQFRFDGFAIADKQTQMGIVAFLTRSDLGLTKGDATAAWKLYGADAINMIRECPSDVVVELESDADQHTRIYDASRGLQGSRHDAARIELFELFSGRGFPRTAVKACIATWGSRAPEIVRRDPFAMLVADVPGVGFKRADKLYLDRGGKPDRLKRQMLAAWHGMRTANTGNTWDGEAVLLKAILREIGSIADASRAIELGIRAGWIVRRHDGDWQGAVFGGVTQTLEAFYAERAAAAAEERLAKHIRRVLSHKPAWPVVTADDLADDHQRGKLAEIAGASVAILAGTPGTGKTFAAAVLIRLLLKRLPPGRIAVCAPTGKASVRITEAMRRYSLPLTATTIHQLLEIDGNTHGDQFTFLRNEHKPLDAAVVVMDEASMCDVSLAASLFAAVPPGGNVLLVGDPFQLPPVGGGAPLRDAIASAGATQ